MAVHPFVRASDETAQRSHPDHNLALLQKSRRHHQNPRPYHQCPTKAPSSSKPTSPQYRPRNRRPGQRTQTRYRKPHAQSRAYQRPVPAKGDEDRGRQGDECPGEEAEEEAEHDHAADAVDGDEAEGADSRNQNAGEKHVHGARALCEVIGRDPTEHRSRIQDGEEVEGQLSMSDVLRFRVVLDVEKRYVETHKSD